MLVVVKNARILRAANEGVVLLIGCVAIALVVERLAQLGICWEYELVAFDYEVGQEGLFLLFSRNDELTLNLLYDLLFAVGVVLDEGHIRFGPNFVITAHE